MTARLLLIRHGQIPANVSSRWHGSTDEPLTEKGLADARRLAAHLVRTRPQIRAVYTSPLQRARSTAEAIAAPLGLAPIVMPGLAEYAIGVLENETFSDLADRHRFFEQTDADPTWAPAGGESLQRVGERVVGAWRTIAAAHADQEVAVVSHGAAISTGLAVLLHEDPRAWMRYRLRNTSVSEFVVHPVPELLTLDVIDHLQ